jgi:hypothetical protein
MGLHETDFVRTQDGTAPADLVAGWGWHLYRVAG